MCSVCDSCGYNNKIRYQPSKNKPAGLIERRSAENDAGIGINQLYSVVRRVYVLNPTDRESE